MRIQCCICSDLFDYERNIAGVPCGHTFHEECLQRWLDTSSTCPHCRKPVHRNKVIRKLYFDQPDDNTEDNVDADRIKNQLDSVKLQLQQKEKEKRELTEERLELEKHLLEVEKNRNKLKALHKQEQATNLSLRKEVAYYQSQQNEAEHAKNEARKLRKKLQDLQSVEQVIKGNEGDIDDLVNKQGSGDGAMRQLATFVVLLKQEKNKIKEERNALRNDCDRLKKEVGHYKKGLLEKNDELIAAREQLKLSEEDLKHTEEENKGLKKRLEKFKKAIESPSNTASSLTHRLLNESPAPFMEPKLSKPQNDQDEIDLDLTPDMFESYIENSKSPVSKTQTKRSAPESENEFHFKIKSAASANPPKKAKREVQDVSNFPGFGQFNILNKKKTNQSSIFKKGYNGMGGHSQFVEPFRKPNGVPPKKSSMKVFGRSKVVKSPQLPTLDGFVTLD